MANVSVYNMEGKEVGTIELKRCCIRCRSKRAPGTHGSCKPACK